MDRQEAIRVLQSHRPDKEDAARPLYAEALRLVESDPELRTWWKAQQSFDRKVVAKLGEVPVPADLRANILARQKIKPFRLPNWLPETLAVAAVVMLICLAGIYGKLPSKSPPLARSDYTAAVLPLLNNDAPTLAMTSPDEGKVLGWLKDLHAPMGSLPAKVGALPTVGCQKFTVRGHDVSLICFTMASGRLAHIFIVNQQALSDPPEVGAPEFGQVKGWSTAAWSDGHMSYLLATQAGPDALKQLL